MPRPPSPATRTTLYRITGVSSLDHGIQAKYLHRDFEATKVTVGGREALLVYGAMITQIAGWSATLQALTNKDVALGNRTAAAVLIIRANSTYLNPASTYDDDDGNVAWALTYGMGFQLLDQARVDNGFGQRLAIRTVNPKDLSSLTHATLDHRARIERSTIPGGDNLRAFGAGDVGELVTRLVAKAEIPSLTAGAKPIRIRGADALSVPLGRSPDRSCSGTC